MWFIFRKWCFSLFGMLILCPLFIIIGFPSQAFQLQFFSYGEERIMMFLIHIRFYMIEKDDDSQRLLGLHVPHIKQRVTMFGFLEDILKEWT